MGAKNILNVPAILIRLYNNVGGVVVYKSSTLTAQ